MANILSYGKDSPLRCRSATDDPRMPPPRSLLSPGRLIAASFAGAILVGAALLMPPWVVRPGVPGLTASDALFMSTSAICVTGLAVRDLASFSLLGQVVMLILIQVGGIGIITLSKLALLRAAHSVDLGDRFLFNTMLGSVRHVDPRDVLASTIVYTLSCELIGFALLAPSFIADHGFATGTWAAAFHSVSAFCNAGFSIWSDGLVPYRDHLWVNVVIMVLIIAGGLGFVVIGDVLSWLRRRRTIPHARLSLHSRVVLLTTALLIVGGWLVFQMLETANNAGPIQGRVLPSLFLSVTARTAGFNTVAMDQLSSASLVAMILLMFVGGSPGSTAGGIKTTALAALVATVRARARGRPEAELLGRSISGEVVGRALGATAVMTGVILVGTIVLDVAESGLGPHAGSGAHFLDHLFEVASAVCTVGLSTGITPTVSESGRVVLELCMFVGRVGPLLLAATLFSTARRAEYRLPREDLIIG